jgi:hypothetical protein
VAVPAINNAVPGPTMSLQLPWSAPNRAQQKAIPKWVYGIVVLSVAVLGAMSYSYWEAQREAQRAEAERMKDPAYAETKRKEEAEWEKTRSAMKTLEAQRAQSAGGAVSNSPASDGGAVIVKPGLWPCGSTKAAFWEMTRLSVNGKRELFGTMRRTHSFALQDGAQVEVLEVGLAATRVRVSGQFDPDDGRVHAYPEDARIGRECWVASEAVVR